MNYKLRRVLSKDETAHDEQLHEEVYDPFKMQRKSVDDYEEVTKQGQGNHVVLQAFAVMLASVFIFDDNLDLHSPNRWLALTTNAECAYQLMSWQPWAYLPPGDLKRVIRVTLGEQGASGV